MSLDQFKTIYLWEYAHRLWGRLIGFAYALPFFYFVVRRRLPCPFRPETGKGCRNLREPAIGVSGRC